MLFLTKLLPIKLSVSFLNAIPFQFRSIGSSRFLNNKFSKNIPLKADLAMKSKITKSTTTKRKADSKTDSPELKNPFESAKKLKTVPKQDEISQNSNDIATLSSVIDDANSQASSSINNEDEGTKKVAHVKKPAASKSKAKKKSEDDKNDDADVDAISAANVKYDQEAFKNPLNGKEWNLKISSWNINGVRAWLEKGGLEYVKAEDPDIFCCQETKCDTSKIPPKAELSGYHCYWLSGDQQGYSGVGLMSKVKPIKVTFGIESKKFDDEGRVIVAEYENFYLINSYIPNSSRGLVRLPFRMDWEKAFLEFMNNLEKIKPVVWCGDLNVAHNPIDLKNPDSNTKTAGFTKEERQCFTDLLSNGYFDSFRHLYPTQKGAFTFWSYMRNARAANVGWRLDYFVMSEKLKPSLIDNVIRSTVTGSDHCPIVLFLKLENTQAGVDEAAEPPKEEKISAE